VAKKGEEEFEEMFLIQVRANNLFIYLVITNYAANDDLFFKALFKPALISDI